MLGKKTIDSMVNDPETDASLKFAGRLIQFLPPVIIVIGSIGNVLSIIVFKKASLLKKSTAVLFMTLAMVDTVALYTGLLGLWLVAIADVDVRGLSDVSCKIHTYLTRGSVEGSAWIIVAITIERFLSVLFPFNSRTMCTRGKAVATSIVILMLLAIINMHFFWTVRVNHHPIYNQTTCHGEGKEYDIFITKIWQWFHSSVFSYIPFTIMLGCNIAIIGQIAHVKLRHRSRKLNRQQYPHMSSMTAMLLTISFTFLFTTSPVVICYTFKDHFIRYNGYLQFATTATNLKVLMYCNNAFNFYLYCMSGSSFRKELQKRFCQTKYGKLSITKSRPFSKPLYYLNIRTHSDSNGEINQIQMITSV